MENYLYLNFYYVLTDLLLKLFLYKYIGLIKVCRQWCHLLKEKLCWRYRAPSQTQAPQKRTSRTFLPREAMLSTVYAVVVCLCVCVCVCHTPVLYQNG